MKKLKTKTFIIVIALFVVILGSSITYALVTASGEKLIFKVTDSDDTYSLDLLGNSDTLLCPGLMVSTPFAILNDTDKKIDLSSISFENFSLTDTQSNVKIPERTSRFEHFSDQVSLNLSYKDTTLFDVPIAEILKGETYVFDSSLVFSAGSEGDFSISISMMDSAGNDIQNIKCDFKVLFNFKESMVSTSADDNAKKLIIIN